MYADDIYAINNDQRISFVYFIYTTTIYEIFVQIIKQLKLLDA